MSGSTQRNALIAASPAVASVGYALPEKYWTGVHSYILWGPTELFEAERSSARLKTSTQRLASKVW